MGGGACCIMPRGGRPWGGMRPPGGGNRGGGIRGGGMLGGGSVGGACKRPPGSKVEVERASLGEAGLK